MTKALHGKPRSELEPIRSNSRRRKDVDGQRQEFQGPVNIARTSVLGEVSFVVLGPTTTPVLRSQPRSQDLPHTENDSRRAVTPFDAMAGDPQFDDSAITASQRDSLHRCSPSHESSIEIELGARHRGSRRRRPPLDVELRRSLPKFRPIRWLSFERR